jgi:hypothetical protein
MAATAATTASIPEFDPGIGSRNLGNAVAVFQDTLFVMGAGGGHNSIYQTLFSIGSGAINATLLTNKSLWSSTLLELPVGSSNWVPTTEGLCGAAVSPGSGATGSNPGLYLFWAYDGALMAACCTGITSGENGETTPSWGAPLCLIDLPRGGTVGVRSGGAVSVASLGGDSLVVAMPLTGGSPCLGIAVIDTTTQTPSKTVTTSFGTFGTWDVTGRLNVYPVTELAPLRQWGNNGTPTFWDTGSSVSIVPFVSGVPAGTPPNPNAMPMSYLMLFMTVTISTTESNGHKFSWPVEVMLSLDQNEQPLLILPTADGLAPAYVFYNDLLPAAPFVGVADPVGRVWGFAPNQHEIATLNFPTFSLPSPPASPPLVASGPSAPSASSTPCTALFYMDARSPSTETYTNSNGLLVTTTGFPVYALLFYGGTTKVQALYVGTLSITPGYTSAPVTITVGNETVASFTPTGIIDVPVPIPAENVNGWQLESTENTFASITYGVTNNYVSGGTVTQNWNVGIQADSEIILGFSFLGIVKDRIAIDLGVSYQFQLAISSTTTTSDTLTSSWSLKSDANPVKVQTYQNGQPVTTQVGDGMVPRGGVWGTGATVSLTNFQFSDASGTPIVDGSNASAIATMMAPSVNAASLQLGTSVPKSMIPYMVTPGDLASYTPDGINATMMTLTGGTLPGGTAFKDYFEEIIYPSAQPFAVGNKSQNYLLFSWSTGPMAGETFTAMTQSTQTQSMQHTISAFVGMSWAAGLQVPAFGSARATGSLQLNGGYQYYSSTTSTTTDGWGITISPATEAAPPWGPPNWGESPDYVASLPQPPVVDDIETAWGQAINAYTFALFFLPDPGPNHPNPANLPTGYWVQELHAYSNVNNPLSDPNYTLPANLDVGSGCWRIVFVVTSFTRNDGTTYEYSDPNNWFPHT